MFPMPRCEGCGSRDACAALGAPRPEYPRCRSPLRGVDVGRAAALFAWLARRDGAPSEARAALEGAVIDRFRRDRLVFSDVLEASFSCDPEGAHLDRFSYAFPGFRADPAGVAATLLGLCRPFGAPAIDACHTALRAARSRAVAQPLFGFADDGGGRSRAKLYLQFHAHEAAAALDLAGRLLGRRLDARLAARGPLHLLCLDIGARGLTSAKLYFALDRLRLDAFPARVGPVPLVAALAFLGVSELRNVLAIHRIAGRDDEGLAHPVEVDFSLPDNDLRWQDVRALPPVQALLAPRPEVAALEASFGIAVRRISGSVGEGHKLNVYYVLTELAREAEVASAG